MHINTLLQDASPLIRALFSQWAECVIIDHKKQRVLIEMFNTNLMRIAIPHKAVIQGALFKRLGLTYRVEFYTLEPLRHLKNLSDYYEDDVTPDPISSALDDWSFDN